MLLGRLDDDLEGASSPSTRLGAAEALLGGTAAANFLLVGAAHQSGALPMPAAAIEEAIRINGVAVDANIAAFRWGRAAVGAPEEFDRALEQASGRSRCCPSAGPDASVRRALRCRVKPGDSPSVRAAHLVEYQGEKLARRYLRTLDQVWQAERRLGERTAFSEAVAHGLHKFIAYKDEYEVARLLTDPVLMVAKAQAEVPNGEKLTYQAAPADAACHGNEEEDRAGSSDRIRSCEGDGSRATSCGAPLWTVRLRARPQGRDAHCATTTRPW